MQNLIPYLINKVKVNKEEGKGMSVHKFSPQINFSYNLMGEGGLGYKKKPRPILLS